MDSLFHSLHIGTLTTWLSVAGFGAVGISIAPWQVPTPPDPQGMETIVDLAPSDFLMDAGENPTSGEVANSADEPNIESVPETLPAPAELPPMADLEPLPEIPDVPDLPPPPPKKSAVSERPPKPSNASRSSNSGSRRSSSPSSSGSRSSGSGSGSSAGQGTGGMSNSSRLAAGRMPAPRYPSSSKRKGETGSVTVSFTIGTNGKVISATVSKPSPYPALNEAAVRAVRRWKFPPGGVLKTQRRLDFVLK